VCCLRAAAPQGLFEQFRRVANMYFLAVAGLSLTPFSPISYITTWAPLILVVGISMLKEAMEDYKRHLQDMEQNNSLVDAFKSGSGDIDGLAWKDLRPGDVVRVLRDDFFPADLLFIASSNPEGSCYVETKNLDGETNLKLKKALDATAPQLASAEPAAVSTFRGLLECDAPNNSLYTFMGNLVLPASEQSQGETVPLGPANVLLRGSNLRNTDWVLGCVIYAGHDSKVMMNSMAAPSKRSAIERRLDLVVAAMLFLLFIMCVAGSVIMGLRTKVEGPRMWFMAPDDHSTSNSAYDVNATAAAGFYAGITQFILYGYLIPISLYVSIEMVKVSQSMYFINQDRQMYHAFSDTPALARTSNLNEELGQVATILSDKTGTLTCNLMEFFKCTIGGVKYGAGVTDIERSVAARAGRPLPPPVPGEGVPQEKGFNFRDIRLLGEDGSLAWRNSPDATDVKAFFLLLAVCHTVIPEGEPTPELIKYQAESPDEAAFVVAAKRFGFFFKKRTGSGVTVMEPGPDGTPVDRFYEVLNVLEFNSTRKRMSVVVRDPEGKLTLYCKGADSVIYERLATAGNVHRTAASTHMEEFAQAGLRTLCLAYAPIDAGFYATWNAKYFEAKTSLVERDSKIDAVAELIEKELRLLGATAIEDKLQDGVPACIEHLAQAGVALWVLTGDKQDTAINIGMACSLLRTGMSQHIISLEDLVTAAGGRTNDPELRARAAASVREQLEAALQSLKADRAQPGGGAPASLIIDGFGLTFALSADLAPTFWELGKQCDAVICCRVSPLQKALVTGLVKKAGLVTLAIGDGANDVGMIQAAHIGVGISGQEGMQAVMASDFAIAQFKYLERLVLVHGRYNYKRIARLVTYFFYKNTLFGFTLFWYNGWAFFSGQPCYNDYAMSCYNLFFTSLPIIVVAVLDQDVSAPVSAQFPGLYSQGQRNAFYTWRVIMLWVLNGFWQSIVCFLAVFLGGYGLRSDRESGQVMEMWGAGSAMYTIVVITVTLQLAVTINYWTAIHHFIFWASVALKYAFILVMAELRPGFATSAHSLFTTMIAGTPTYWLLVGLVPVICLLPDFTLRAYACVPLPQTLCASLAYLTSSAPAGASCRRRTMRWCRRLRCCTATTRRPSPHTARRPPARPRSRWLPWARARRASRPSRLRRRLDLRSARASWPPPTTREQRCACVNDTNT
jgi:phospholipid-transporting ATPase